MLLVISRSKRSAAVEGFGYAPVGLGPLRMGRLMQVDGGPLSRLHAIRDRSLG
jgi:8-hydroxy-5-deazaflavin:NADPH oxidoreductase